MVCVLQDAFGENDVYVVTTLGVHAKDKLKDKEGNLIGVISNRPCPSGLGALPVDRAITVNSVFIAHLQSHDVACQRCRY